MKKAWRSQYGAYMAIVPSMIFFALSFVWFKVANVSYGPLTIIFFRLVISAALLLVFNRLTGRLVLPRWRDVPVLCLLGVFEPFLYFVFESYGLQLLSSTVASVIIATIPLVSPLAAYFFLQERIHWRHIVCVAVSFSGVAVVVSQGEAGMTATVVGVLLQFGAVCSAVAYTVVLQRIPRRLNTLSVILYQNIVGGLLFLPLWLMFEFQRFTVTPPDVRGLLAILQLSLVVSTLAFILFTYSVRRLGVNRANMFINMIPVFTALFAWQILGDALTVATGLGIAMVIGGLFLAERLRAREDAIMVQGA